MFMKVTHNLDPIYNNYSKVLILGSMPSVISREANFYYANKSNRFWKILSVLFCKKLDNNKDKEKFLLENNIALWDVIKSCDIKGSSDTSIKNVIVNDIESILKNSNIKAIACTGLKAYKLFNKYFDVNCDVIYLPSPSSANAKLSLDDLVNEYKVIKDYLDS